jgi:hypothetical protein
MDKVETTSAGSRRYKHVGVKGDLRIELHFADVNDGHGSQACLYIAHMLRPKDGVLVPFAGMWRYAQAGALDTVVRPLAKHLYNFVTRMDEIRVLDAVLDYLQDLKDHPPEPGHDKSLDDFLAECDEEDTPFFLEINGERIIG